MKKFVAVVHKSDEFIKLSLCSEGMRFNDFDKIYYR